MIYLPYEDRVRLRDLNVLSQPTDRERTEREEILARQKPLMRCTWDELNDFRCQMYELRMSAPPNDQYQRQLAEMIRQIDQRMSEIITLGIDTEIPETKPKSTVMTENIKSTPSGKKYSWSLES